MSSKKSMILGWAEQGHIAKDQLLDALVITDVLPTAQDWRRYLDQLLLWSSVLLLSAAVIFFFAFNWDDLGRYSKFGLVEGLIVVSMAVYWKFGDDRLSAKASLLVASILIGVLLALFGQTYQTGADTWELFASWAALIFPWALLGRFAPLWILWISLINLAIILYFQVFQGLFGITFSTDRQLIVLFFFNTTMFVLWEFLAARIDWLAKRWAVRLLVFASGGAVTMLMVNEIFNWLNMTSGLAWLIYPAWLAAIFAVYRYRIPDLFMLAGGCLSAIVVITSFLSKHLIGSGNAGAFLFIGLIIVGLSAGAAVWLKRIASEQEMRS